MSKAWKSAPPVPIMLASYFGVGEKATKEATDEEKEAFIGQLVAFGGAGETRRGPEPITPEEWMKRYGQR